MNLLPLFAPVAIRGALARIATIFVLAAALISVATSSPAATITIDEEAGAVFDGILDGFPGIAAYDGEPDLGENNLGIALKLLVTEERAIGEFPLPPGVTAGQIASAAVVFNIDDVLSTFGPGTDFASRASKTIFLHLYSGDGAVVLGDFKNIQAEPHVVDTTISGTITDATLRTTGPVAFSVDVTDDVRALLASNATFAGVVWRTNDSPTGTSLDNLGDSGAGPPGVGGARLPALVLELSDASPTPTGTPTVEASATSTALPTETATRRPPPTGTPTRTLTPTVPATSTATVPASTPTSTRTITPTVTFVQGDANCDGVLNAADLERLNLLLFDAADADLCVQADANDDGRLNAADLPALVSLLQAGT